MSDNRMNEFKKAFQEEAFELAFSNEFNSTYEPLGAGNFGKVYRIPCANGDIAVKCIGVQDDRELRRVLGYEVRSHKKCGIDGKRIVGFIDYDFILKKDGKRSSDYTDSDEETSSKSSSSSADDTDSDEETSSKSSSDETGDVFAYVLIFLQLVEGIELAKYLHQNTELSELDQLIIFSDILEGVKEIHSEGIVHCDLKPQNIMVWSDSSSGKIEIKIFDFGISCDLSRTFNEILAGTAGYAPFEQEQDEPAVSFASDVHALGRIFLDLRGFDIRNRTGDSENWNFSESATMEGLVRNMLRMAPEERPELDEVIEIVQREIEIVRSQS